MKQTLVIATLLIAFTRLLMPASAQDYRSDAARLKAELQGTWSHFDFYYVFEPDSTMHAVTRSGGGVSRETYTYTVFVSNDLGFVRYRKAGDSGHPSFLHVTDVEDSTAVIALGTLFVRADSGRGLKGNWRHAEDLSVIDMTFGDGRISYIERELDMSTGEMATVEERTGDIAPAAGRNRRRFVISYDDGTSTTVAIVLAGDILYLFDLAPRKSLFVRRRTIPGT